MVYPRCTQHFERQGIGTLLLYEQLFVCPDSGWVAGTGRSLRVYTSVIFFCQAALEFVVDKSTLHKLFAVSFDLIRSRTVSRKRRAPYRW